MLISENTKKALFKISKKCFQMNRMWDRNVSVLSVDFAMVKASNILHLRFAHKFPLLADKVSEILDAFNEKVDYLVTDADVSNYSTIMELFQNALDEMMSLNSMVKEGIKLAEEADDLNVKVMLEQFMLSLTPYINQSIILRDKAKLYNTSVALYDHNIDSFFLIE